MRSGLLSKRWLINYLLIGLICLFTLIGKRYPIDNKKELSLLNPQDIETIQIEATGDTLIFSKEVDEWHIVSPVQWPARNEPLQRLLNITPINTNADYSVAHANPSELGLKQPTAVLTLNDTRILFGVTNPIGENRYLQIGSRVYLAPDQQLPFMSQGISGLIDRRLLPRSQPLQTLKLIDITINKQADGSWRTEANTGFAVDKPRQLVNNWQTREALHVEAYDSTKIPRQKIIARLQDKSEIEFYLMSIQPEIILARPDLKVQYHFDGNQYYDFLAIAD